MFFDDLQPLIITHFPIQITYGLFQIKKGGFRSVPAASRSNIILSDQRADSQIKYHSVRSDLEGNVIDLIKIIYDLGVVGMI
jgi:hypothetical protein